MQSTIKYKDGYIHSTYPDDRYPAGYGREPKHVAQIGDIKKVFSTFAGCQRFITKVLKEQQWLAKQTVQQLR